MNLSGRMLAEYSALEHILLGDLRDVLEEPDDEETRHWLAVILDGLLAIVPREFALKQEGGYLAGVLEEYPNWHDQVDSLQAGHRQLCSTLGELRARLDAGTSYAIIAQWLRPELRAWMQRLADHQRSERHLLQTAMNLEVGVGD